MLSSINYLFSNIAYLGKISSGASTNEVELPAWAKNEHDFVRIHREFLESRQVRGKLRYWMDLMFGIKQKTETEGNIFYAYAYENYVKAKKDVMMDHNIDTINEFMQVPIQLFNEPLFKIDKKAAPVMLSSQQLAVIPEEYDFDDSKA
jgi:hypothetical protein